MGYTSIVNQRGFLNDDELYEVPANRITLPVLFMSLKESLALGVLNGVKEKLRKSLIDVDTAKRKD